MHELLRQGLEPADGFSGDGFVVRISDWTSGPRFDLEAVMRLELPPEIVEPWLTAHPERLCLTYGYVLFATTKPCRPNRFRSD